MNILWISDGKKGHEKQVEILLNEISKTENIIIERNTNTIIFSDNKTEFKYEFLGIFDNSLKKIV